LAEPAATEKASADYSLSPIIALSASDHLIATSNLHPTPMIKLFRIAALILLSAFIALPSLAQNWTGEWESRWRTGGARITLSQQGDRVTGSYTPYDGVIGAQVEGRRLIGEWIEGPRRGGFEFAISPDGRSFAGRFDSGEWWNGRRLAANEKTPRVDTSNASPRDALRSFLLLLNIHRGRPHDVYERLSRLVTFGPDQASLPTDDKMATILANYDLIDQFRLRLWEVPGASDAAEVSITLKRPDGAQLPLIMRRAEDGWRVVMRGLQEALDTTKILAAQKGPMPRGAFVTPRATMQSFLWAMGDSSSEGRSQAAMALDLSRVPLSIRSTEGPLRAEFLKSVLDRAGLVVLQEIPNDPQAPEAYEHYAHPAGRIVIERVERDGEQLWLFSADTVMGLRDLHEAVEALSLISGIRLHEAYSSFFIIRSWIGHFNHHLLENTFLLENWQWIALLLIVVLGYFGGHLLAFLVFMLLGPRLARLAPERNWALEKRVKLPVRLCFAAALWFAAIGAMGLPEMIQYGGQAIAVSLMSLGLIWAGYTLVDLVTKGFQERSQAAGLQFDRILVSLIATALKVALAVGGIIVVADILNMPWQGVIAGLGVGGLAVAFAARATVENFFGAAMLLSDRPFKTGDAIVVGNISGSVENVGLRSTRIRTADDSVVYIPNATLAAATIDNRGRRRQWLFKTVFAISYDTAPDKLDAFVRAVKEIVRAHPAGKNGRLHCAVVNLTENAIEVELVIYLSVTSAAEEREAKHAILLDVMRRAETLGVSFASAAGANAPSPATSKR
jgi:small-conductance mechanosensitive channel